MPSIQVENLGKNFRGTPAVDRVTFTVADGRFCTLLGPSGCGKTTTLRLIAGLERPDSGQIQIGPQVVSSAARGIVVPPERRRIGLVFQSYALWPHMTVFDHVAYPLRVRGLKQELPDLRERVQRALDLVRLTSAERHRYPSELSGGQQQRVALARAIVFEPTILLLDEPLSNLDAELRKQMRSELRLLHERLGITSVYVTHDQFEALALSDLVVVMDQGSVVESGTPHEIYERPQTRHCAQFVGAANVFEGQVVGRRGRRLVISVTFGGTVEVEVASPERYSPSKRITLAIKPEDLVVYVGSRDGQQRFGAEVEVSTYLGSHTDVLLKLGATLVRARVPKFLRLTHGSTVTVEFPAQALRVFDPGDGRLAGQAGEDVGKFSAHGSEVVHQTTLIHEQSSVQLTRVRSRC